MKLTRSLRRQLQLQKIVFIVLLLTVTGLLAWVSQQHSVQFDWTSNKRNSLSAGSIELLKNMDDVVTINVYMADDAQMKAAVEEILQRYQREKQDLTYKLINPDIDIDLAQLDGVSQYGQVVIKYRGRRETVTSLSEQTLSSALQRLSRSGNRSLVFLGGHGERRIDGGNNTGYSQLTAELKKHGFNSTQHNLLESPLPADTTALVIAAPGKVYLEGELEHIKNYISSGGNLLWMMDPGEMAGLEALATTLGIEFLDGMVVDNNTNLRETLRIQHPAMIPVLDYAPHPITSSLDYNTLFPLSRGVTQLDDSGWKRSTIAQSLPRSWLEKAILATASFLIAARAMLPGRFRSCSRLTETAVMKKRCQIRHHNASSSAVTVTFLPTAISALVPTWN